MSSRGKWIVGLSVVGLMGLAMAGVTVTLAGMAFAMSNVNFVLTVPRDEQLETQFAQSWLPPDQGADASRLFPQQINDWQSDAPTDSATVSELAIEEDGLHTRYRAGNTTVDVYVYAIPSERHPAVIQTAQNSISAAQYETSVSHRSADSVSQRMDFTVSPPKTNGRMWGSRDWLFVFTTRDSSVDLDTFKHDYLRAIAGPPAND